MDALKTAIREIYKLLTGPVNNVIAILLIVLMSLYTGLGGPREDLTPLALTGSGSNITGNLTVSGSTTTAGVTSSSGLTVSSGNLAVTTGNATVGGTLGVTGITTFSASPLFASESITPTDGGTFTPTVSLVTLTPAGALGTAIGACTTGQQTTLYNSVNASVVITDTGNFVGAGNATLGQFDALRLVCFDSKWVQASAVSAN